MDDPRLVYEGKEDFQLLDVREPYEWDAGHIEGSIHIPLAEVMAGKEQGRLSRDRPVLVLCRSGSRSELAATMLQARGFDAQNFRPGTEGWAAAGLPLVATDGGPGQVV